MSRKPPRLHTLPSRLTALPPRLATATTATLRQRGRKGVDHRRRRLLASNFMCEMCAAEGIMRTADVVDHIVPLAHGGSDTDANTRNLCHAHHKQVTAEQFGHAR